MALSEKGKALSKWCSSDGYRNGYDRIFSKKEDTNRIDQVEKEVQDTTANVGTDPLGTNINHLVQ
jgi:hypothetical protein